MPDTNSTEVLTYQVIISKKEYDSLIKDSNFLRALQGAGVDNWEGYIFAIEMMDEDDEE